MKSYFLKYGSILGGTLFLFVNFIACGSQLYQVTMEDDMEQGQIPAAALDPASTTYGIHAASGWGQKLPINFRFGESMNQMQKDALTKAMASWEKAIGRKLFTFEGVDEGKTGDSFKDLYSSLDDSVNGHYLDKNWEKTAKPTVVLATTIWDNLGSDINQISRADIRFNDQNYLIGDSLSLSASDLREVVDMESLALHELGHLLGLAHVDASVDGNSIMNPHLFIGEGLTSRKMSRGDILRIQTIYGCKDLSCDVDTLIKSIEFGGIPQIATFAREAGEAPEDEAFEDEEDESSTENTY